MDWKQRLLGTAWIRYYVLGREDAFERLFPDIRSAFPETVSDLDAIQAAWLTSTRHRLITRMLLRLPGLSPRVLWTRSTLRTWWDLKPSLVTIADASPNDGNWWCPMDPDRARRDAFTEMTDHLTRDWWAAPNDFNIKWTGDVDDLPPTIDRLAVSWLHAQPLTHDLDFAELDALSRTPSGPSLLAGQAVRWARQSNMVTRWLGLDRELPETLALAVRATRFGCRMAGSNGPVSHAAWAVLHRTYPQTEWSRRTPYWFDQKPIDP